MWSYSSDTVDRLGSTTSLIGISSGQKRGEGGGRLSLSEQGCQQGPFWLYVLQLAMPLRLSPKTAPFLCLVEAAWYLHCAVMLLLLFE